MTGGVGARPGMYPPGGGGGRARGQYGEARQRGAASPVGWDKSYPLDPVEAVNSEVGAGCTVYCAVLYCVVLYCTILCTAGGGRQQTVQAEREQEQQLQQVQRQLRAPGAGGRHAQVGHCAAH